jgi:hypothetical protein
VGAVGFRDWGEVASWLDAISAGTGTSDDAVIRRARDLVAGAGSELDTLRRLGQFVQQVQYASIQVGLSRGGGYRPHAPGQVLARGYGDCKDKANLLRSLLAAVGRASYLVSLHAGDPEYVSREWPSPASFDHCILAIPLRASRGFPAEVRASRFGTLLIFDPTAPSTPLGSLPLADQGGWAMLSAAGEHEPFRLPVLAPESSWIERRVDLSLDADGGAAATLIERCAGDAAMRVRALLHGLNRLDYRTAIETVVHQAAPGSSVGRVWVRDDTLAGHFETEAEFQVPRYAQLMQSRLMVVKPLLLSHLGVALAEDHPRRYPVELSCEAVRETLIVHLPAGFTVDELPDSAAIETPFASFHSHSRIEGAALRLSLSLTVREAMVPANQFHSVRDFYARVRSAEETPAVLAKE